MPNPKIDDKSVYIDREENITKGNVSAKRVALYTYDSGADELNPYTATGGSIAKATDAYGIQAISEDATYKYYFFEDDSANYYVMRKHATNNVYDYTKGTGGYSSVYVDSSNGPSGSPTWADRGATF